LSGQFVGQQYKKVDQQNKKVGQQQQKGLSTN
jgi:hypothetical protein